MRRLLKLLNAEIWNLAFFENAGMVVMLDRLNVFNRLYRLNIRLESGFTGSLVLNRGFNKAELFIATWKTLK